MIYLTPPELLHVAQRTLGQVKIGDRGLLESALARPQATGFGEDAYPTLELKAAALVHSVAKNRALVDGNKSLALAALLAFLGMNGVRVTFTNEEVYDFIIDIAAGKLDRAGAIAQRLGEGTEPH